MHAIECRVVEFSRLTGFFTFPGAFARNDFFSVPSVPSVAIALDFLWMASGSVSPAQDRH